MKNNTTDYETKINELQEEQEQLRQDINILWELYGSDKNIQDEKIQATAAIISLASLLITLVVALIIGLKITGGI